MNYKKVELIKDFISTIEKQFPDIKFLYILDGTEDPEDVWVHFQVPDDEEKMSEISDFASTLTSDLLIEYGWLFLICQHNVKYAKAA